MRFRHGRSPSLHTCPRRHKGIALSVPGAGGVGGAGQPGGELPRRVKPEAVPLLVALVNPPGRHGQRLDGDAGGVIVIKRKFDTTCLGSSPASSPAPPSPPARPCPTSPRSESRASRPRRPRGVPVYEANDAILVTDLAETWYGESFGPKIT